MIRIFQMNVKIAGDDFRKFPARSFLLDSSHCCCCPLLFLYFYFVSIVSFFLLCSFLLFVLFVAFVAHISLGGGFSNICGMFTPIQIGEDEQPILTLRIFFRWVETQPPTSSLLTGDFVDHVTGPTAPTAVQERLFFNSEVSTRRGGQRFLQNRSERSHIISFTLRIIGPSKLASF